MINTDISQIRKIEIALKESEETFNAFINIANENFVLFNSDLNIIKEQFIDYLRR